MGRMGDALVQLLLIAGWDVDFWKVALYSFFRWKAYCGDRCYRRQIAVIRKKTRNPHLWQLDGETGERDVTPDEEEDGISLECTTQEGRGRNVESVTEDESPKRQIPDIHTWAKPLRSDERFTIRGNPFIDGYEEIVVFAPPGIPLSQIKSALKPDFDWDHIRPTSYTQRKWVYYPWSTNTLQEISQLLQAGSYFLMSEKCESWI